MTVLYMKQTDRHFLSLLRQFFLNEKYFRVVERIKTTFYLRQPSFFFKSYPSYKTMWKNIVQRGRPQMKIWLMPIACCIPKATKTQTHRLYNNYCFSTATMVARTRLGITLYYRYITCLVNFENICLFYAAKTNQQFAL
jgi:hypothetical protein